MERMGYNRYGCSGNLKKEKKPGMFSGENCGRNCKN
jgi:hypothetical protein